MHGSHVVGLTIRISGAASGIDRNMRSEIRGLALSQSQAYRGNAVWAEAGAQISTIAELLGHADLRMTARYTHATDYAKRRAVEAAARIVELENSGHKEIAGSLNLPAISLNIKVELSGIEPLTS